MNDEFWETGRGMCGNSPCAWAKRWLLLFFREVFGAEHDVGAVHRTRTIHIKGESIACRRHCITKTRYTGRFEKETRDDREQRSISHDIRNEMKASRQ